MKKENVKDIYAALRKLDVNVKPSDDAISFAREMGVSGTSNDDVAEQIRSLTKVAHASDEGEFGDFMASQLPSPRLSLDQLGSIHGGAARATAGMQEVAYKGWWMEKADKGANSGSC